MVAVILAAGLAVVVIAQPPSVIHPTTTTITTTKTVASTSTSTSILTTTLTRTLVKASTSTTSIGSTATAMNPTNGLELRLYLSTTQTSGTEANLSISADVYNPSSAAANVTSANDWVVPLNWTNGAPCRDSGQTVGFAMAQGYYASSNITAARLYDLVNTSTTYMCPLYFGYGDATGFLFQPMSDSGSAYGCIGVSPTCYNESAKATYDSIPLIVAGYYQGGAFTPFPRGTYTILAEDEWGALALAYLGSVTGCRPTNPFISHR